MKPRSCLSCGDPIGSVALRRRKLKLMERPIPVREFFHCEECANELFRDHVSPRPSRHYLPGDPRKAQENPPLTREAS